MDPQRWQRIKAIALEAQRRSDTDRRGFLVDACGDDSDLLREVETYLHTAPEDLPEYAPGLEGDLEGTRLGDYRLVERLGAGGMGVVYRAIREGDFDHEVAVKLLRPGLHQDHVQRFEKERRILAQLEHPHVARLLGGGQTDHGHPYFTMELVIGTPVDRFCNRHRWDLTRRLRLFAKICRAVSYAHRNLIIHRDIKPSNILVTEGGDPKLVDFGIAGLLDDSGHPSETLTQPGGRPMTPEYASPEQVRGERLTTATDLWSLGVVLYRLLTGRGPFQFPSRQPEVVGVILREQRPTKPSQVVKISPTRQRDATEPAFHIGPTSPKELSRHLRGDLDCILLKALAYDPAERYESCEQFAEDIERYLDGYPVRARQWATLYLMTKFLRRYRVPVAVLSLAVGAITTAAVVAFDAEKRADFRRGQAEALVGFMLGDLKDKLDTVGRLDLLEDVTDQAQSFFATLPHDVSGETAAQQVRSLLAIGEIRLKRGNPKGALESFGEALSRAEVAVLHHPNDQTHQTHLAHSHYWLGEVHFLDGRLDLATHHFQGYQEVADAMRARHPDSDYWRLEASYAHNNLGAIHRESGDIARAMSAFAHSVRLKRELLRGAPDDASLQLDLADSLTWYAETAWEQFALARALDLRREAKAIYERLVTNQPENIPLAIYLAESCQFVARSLVFQGKADEAVVLSRRGLDLAANLVTHDPANADWREARALAQLNLATTLLAGGHLEEADAQSLGALEAMQDLASKHPDFARWSLPLAAAYNGRAKVLMALGAWDRALSAAREAERQFPDPSPPSASGVAAVLLQARIAKHLGKEQVAQPLLKRVLALTDDHYLQRFPYAMLRAKALVLMGDSGQAQPLLDRLAESGVNHPDLRDLVTHHLSETRPPAGAVTPDP
ncbi:Non-specific serine/threonine protein kinase [Sulfidibacter corallicola]|uniref:Protein kinase n=1 Tax=Sulfidibacter corallicola TaxID=2818388 RepID=A0A8A4TI89_SULCO|nr:serine/threonine-protein kinase [Sulfidibacter corallicola]QTD48872.1 protein kinase [Sulfidibacter corallicola]